MYAGGIGLKKEAGGNSYSGFVEFFMHRHDGMGSGMENNKNDQLFFYF